MIQAVFYLKKLKILLLFSLVICIFISYNIQNNYKIPNDYIVSGIIKNYKIDENKLSLEISGKYKFIGNYYFKSEEEKKTIKKYLNYGYKIRLKGVFKEPVSNTNFNLFNYKNYLKSKKIYYI